MEAIVLDFGNLPYKQLDGTIGYIKDFNKDFGNFIHFTAQDIGEMQIGDAIYNNPEVEITKDNAAIIKAYLGKKYLAYVKLAIIPYCNKALELTDDPYGLPVENTAAVNSTVEETNIEEVKA